MISQDQFDDEFGVLEEALEEVQRRGRKMMDTVLRQKEVLVRLEQELGRSRERREEVVREVREQERRKEDVERKRKEEEWELERVGKLLMRIAGGMDSLEDTKNRWSPLSTL